MSRRDQAGVNRYFKAHTRPWSPASSVKATLSSTSEITTTTVFCLEVNETKALAFLPTPPCFTLTGTPSSTPCHAWLLRTCFCPLKRRILRTAIALCCPHRDRPFFFSVFYGPASGAQCHLRHSRPSHHSGLRGAEPPGNAHPSCSDHRPTRRFPSTEPGCTVGSEPHSSARNAPKWSHALRARCPRASTSLTHGGGDTVGVP